MKPCLLLGCAFYSAGESTYEYYEYCVLVGNYYCCYWFYLLELSGTRAGALHMEIIGITNYKIWSGSWLLILACQPYLLAWTGSPGPAELCSYWLCFLETSLFAAQKGLHFLELTGDDQRKLNEQSILQQLFQSFCVCFIKEGYLIKSQI